MNTLDTICKSVLLRKRYPMFYYLDALLSARDCLRNLHLHSLQVVNTRRFTVDDYGGVDFDGNIADIVSVEIENGKRLVLDDSTNSRNALDDSYSDETTVSYRDTRSGTYRKLSGRNKLNVSGASFGGTVLISYITDGRDTDAATNVDIYAEAAIEAYVLWQFAEMSRSYGLGEKERLEQKYIKEVQILRSAKANWDLGTLRRIVHRTPSWNIFKYNI